MSTTKRKASKIELPEAKQIGRDAQPVNTVMWVHRDTLHANLYNPNHVAPIEMELLMVSILEDGWTQPIVVTRDEETGYDEITDGFHRWTCSAHPAIYAITDGYVPIVYRKDTDNAGRKKATIRQNRARGTHAVLKMADIVRDLIDNDGMSREEVMVQLRMEEEEILRLYDRSGMTNRGSKNEFNNGWVPGE